MGELKIEQKLEQKSDSKIDYEGLEQRRALQLQSQLQSELMSREAGKAESLRRIVLRLVASGNYDNAVEVVEMYVKSKNEYPAIGIRSEAHSRHVKELIHAIRTKRNFPNLSQLPMSKQQEIIDYAVSHFEELKMTLKTIEQIVRDEMVKDIRSTIWVVRTSVYVVIIVFATMFITEFTDSLAKPLWSVFSDLVERCFKFISYYLPFI